MQYTCMKVIYAEQGEVTCLDKSCISCDGLNQGKYETTAAPEYTHTHAHTHTHTHTHTHINNSGKQCSTFNPHPDNFA
jgi:phage FluMu protein Com